MTSNTTAALSVQQLSLRFGGLQALDGLSFDVASGEAFGLIGPNGAGKTTLFNAIAGEYPPNTGRIQALGHDVTALRPDQRCRLGIARTFQITQPFNELSLEENLMVAMLGSGLPLQDLRARVPHYLERVGLIHKRRELARTLSTGQRKRLELARAIATEPKILLLDEVTGGVDLPSIAGLVELIQSLHAQGMTLVVIEHNVRVMATLVDRAMFMVQGRSVVVGSPQEVASHPEVERLYLGSEK